MIRNLSRLLRVGSLRSELDADDPERAAALPPATLHPLVDLAIYAEDCILTGRARLSAERLTDMLNAHDEIILVDVRVETFDETGVVEVKEVLVMRDEILLVQTAGPRGSQARRLRTRQHPVAIQIGRYEVRGYLHALYGSDPITSIRRREGMVPLTDALVTYQMGSVRQRQRVGAIVINRDHIDGLAPAFET